MISTHTQAHAASHPGYPAAHRTHACCPVQCSVLRLALLLYCSTGDTKAAVILMANVSWHSSCPGMDLPLRRRLAARRSEYQCGHSAVGEGLVCGLVCLITTVAEVARTGMWQNGAGWSGLRAMQIRVM